MRSKQSINDDFYQHKNCIAKNNPEHNQAIILTRGVVGQEQFEGIQLLLPLHPPGKDDIHEQKFLIKK